MHVDGDGPDTPSTQQESTDTQEDILPDSHAPAWFLEHNVRTPAELEASHPRIDIAWKSSETRLELVDVAKSALICDAEGKLPVDEQAIVLVSTSEYTICFLDEFVGALARDLGATLVMIHHEDFCDMDYSLGLDKYGKPFPAAKSHQHSDVGDPGCDIVSAILNAARPQSIALSWLTDDNHALREKACLLSVNNGPVIIHLPDAHRTWTGSQQRCMKTLIKAVKKRRNAGQKLIIVCSISDQTEDRDEALALLRALAVSKASEVVIEPKPLIKDKLLDMEESMIRNINTRQLKRDLRCRLPGVHRNADLEPLATWPKWIFGPKVKSLRFQEWPPEEVKRASMRITANAVENGGLDLDILQRNLTILQRRLESEKPSVDAERRGQETEETLRREKERLKRIKVSCDKYEKELLSYVVNKEHIQSTYEDVIVEPELKDVVKTIVASSKLQLEAKSALLLQHIRMKGMLLYGPPGTGKTHLSRAVAKESGSCMLAINAAGIESKWVGETEKYIRAAFTLATKMHPCVLFIDEVDALFLRRRPGDASWRRSALTQFLQQMDGLIKTDDAPFVLVATNRPDDLDDAFLRRLPQKILLPLPEKESRAQILRLFLKSEDLDPSVDLNVLAERTEGYSGSDIQSLCAGAAMDWMMEQQREQKEASDETQDNRSLHVWLTSSHFDKALQRIRPTVSPEVLNQLEDFTKRFGSGSTRVLPT